MDTIPVVNLFVAKKAFPGLNRYQFRIGLPFLPDSAKWCCMKLSALHLSLWLNEARDILIGSTIDLLHKDELRKLVGIELHNPERIVLSYLFLPGESLLHFDQNERKARIRAKTTNFLPQLLGGKIREIDQVNFDRIIRFTIETDDSDYLLIFELFGPGSNVYLTELNGEIVTSLKRVEQMDVYSPPIPPEGMTPEEISPDAIIRESENYGDMTISGFLRQMVRGCDRSFWQIVLKDDDPDREVSKFTETEMREFLSYVSNEFRVCMDGGRRVFLRGTELTWIADESASEYDNINAAFSDISQELGYSFATKSLRQRISQGLKTHRKRLETKKTKLQKALDESEDAEKYKLYAELLAINRNKIKRGMSSITVSNLYDEDLSEIAIPLQPDLAPSANIERLFRRYRKLTDSVDANRKQIKEIDISLQQLADLKAKLERVESFSDIIKLDDELVKAGILSPRKKKPQTSKVEPVERFNPRTYTTSDGETVLVGKNNKENEYVSFTAANKHDLWFHSELSPGSHVILKLNSKKEEPSRRSIVETAQIAAYHSKSRTSSSVAIIYTEVRHLQKIKGGPPGKVRYTNVKSIMVEPKLP